MTSAHSDQPALIPAEMRDTTRPWMIPAEYRGAVLAYPDGDFTWPPAQVRRFSKVIHLSVTRDPAAARFARGKDVERYDATVQDVPPFLDLRAELGHSDGTVYCSRSTLAPLYAELGDRRPRLIIATLDSYPWTPAEMVADVAAHWGVELQEEWIWGIQTTPSNSAKGIYWDTTWVWGKPDFYNPQAA